MKRLLEITMNDLRLLLREKQTFLFFILMPIGFTLIFGLAFGSFPKQTANGNSLPIVAVLDQDQSIISQKLTSMLDNSITDYQFSLSNYDEESLDKDLRSGKIKAAIIIPTDFSSMIYESQPKSIKIIFHSSNKRDTFLIQNIQKIVNRTLSSVNTATMLLTVAPQLSFDEVFTNQIEAWNHPPVSLSIKILNDKNESNSNLMSAAQTAPGMMLQFSLAGLLTAGQMIVNERKTRVFHRLITTTVKPVEILFGHFFAIFLIIISQFLILITFGNIVMKLNYFNQPGATLILCLACAFCFSAIGLLIGMLAKTDDQAIIFALIPMFVFSGLGGAWMPLEFTNKTFQTIGHLSPIAWAMDGFKAILINSANLESILNSAFVLMGFAVIFFLLAALVYRKKQT